MEITQAEITSAAAAAQNAPAAQELMGAEILVKALQAEGVQYIWGYPGGAVLYIYDAIFKGVPPEGAEDEPGEDGGGTGELHRVMAR